MSIARLIPSAYSVSNANYVSVSNPSNMYANVDSTTYATATSSRASTTTYYVYIKGFNLSTIPDDVIINSITVKVKGYESGLSTSTSYAPRLVNNTSTISAASAASSNFGTSTKTIDVPIGTLEWDDLKEYGSNLGIRVAVRRSNSNTQGYLYIYGGEIEVDYTVKVYHDVTLTNSTSAIVSVSDAHPLEGTDVTIVADTLSDIAVTDNGADVTNQFIHGISDSLSEVPTSTFTTGFSASDANFYQNSSTTSTAWLEYAIGHSAESPYSTSNTSNTYVKPEGDTGWINYHFDFSEIPIGATITSVGVKVYGARENATIDSSHVARFQCYSGNTAKGSIQNFTSTTNSLVEVSNVGSWTRAELQDAQLRFEIGYYGGRMLGITWAVEYEVDGYVYTITSIATDHAIVFSPAGGSGNPPVITVGVPSRTIISDESGYDQCVCTFKSDIALSQWEVRATKAGVTPARGVGLLVESGGALSANTNATIYVDDEELTQGDGDYTITVYGRSTGGVWSE